MTLHDLAIDAAGCPAPRGAGRTRRTAPGTTTCPRCHSFRVTVDAFNRGRCDNCRRDWRPKRRRRVMFWFADWESN